MLVGSLAGVQAMAIQVRCVDSAREAARLAARGDERMAVAAAGRIAPAGAQVQVRAEGDYVVARVSADSPLWLGFELTAEAVAVREPGR